MLKKRFKGHNNWPWNVENMRYDLAIGEMAVEFQIEEAPTFDNIFVTLGLFHIEMTFFSVTGKYISQSG